MFLVPTKIKEQKLAKPAAQHVLVAENV
jgi:hypothetical protein